MKRLIVCLFIAFVAYPVCGGLPRPDHVVIVIFENHSFSEIIGNTAAAPNFNALASDGAVIVPDPSDPTAARSGSHGLDHPSQPNYLELFSGDKQGVLGDGYPGTAAEPGSSPLPFNTANLGAQLVSRAFTFATYSETLPAVGSQVEANSVDAGLNEYARKHNPEANWQSGDAPANNHLAPELNQPFTPVAGQPGTGFPSDFTQLPTVSFVVPNEQHDMHDGSIQQADAWLKANIIDTYYAWAKTHNSLLIVTFDEDDHSTNNLITTIFAGPMIKTGQYSELDINSLNPDTARSGGTVTLTGTAMNHYNVLATIEDLYGLSQIGGAIGRPGLSDIFIIPDTFFLNDSTRMIVGSGDNVMIGGFIIGGTGKKKVLLRGIGPSLNANGTPVAGRLQDTVIDLHKGDGTLLASNDDWKSDQQAEIEATGAAPTDDRESAIVISLDPGSYTVVLSGKAGATGIGLVEAYDLDRAAAPRLLNLSTRGNVQTQDNVMIGGIITGGADKARVIFRGIGPSLQSNGSPIAGRLMDPTLELHDSNGATIAFNDNWKDTQQTSIEQTGIAPTDDHESAIVGDFVPGSYTAILRGKSDTQGIGLVEAFKLN